MSIRVNVDVTNPGQFFACYGLLELADRLWPGAEGWFEGDQFNIECEVSLKMILAILVMDPPQELTTLDNGLAVKPLIAPLRFSFDGGAMNAITLDAWMTIKIEKGQVVAAANAPWNFWSGQQTSLNIWSALRQELTVQLGNLGSELQSGIFNERIFQKGRFGFDPSPAWNALDVGFSPNEQGYEVESSAAVELLAAVGLQRFRPIISANRESFEYATWSNPLSPVVAQAAMAGAIRDSKTRAYRARVVSRGSYAALSFSSPLRGVSDE